MNNQKISHEQLHFFPELDQHRGVDLVLVTNNEHVKNYKVAITNIAAVMVATENSNNASHEVKEPLSAFDLSMGISYAFGVPKEDVVTDIADEVIIIKERYKVNGYGK